MVATRYAPINTHQSTQTRQLINVKTATIPETSQNRQQPHRQPNAPRAHPQPKPKHHLQPPAPRKQAHQTLQPELPAHHHNNKHAS